MSHLLRRSVPCLAFAAAAFAEGGSSAMQNPGVACARDNGGITLPTGFCAAVYADLDGRPRHLVVRSNGDVFVALAGRRNGGGGVVALRDTSGDGIADVQVRFGPGAGGTGIALRGETLYFAMNDAILRYPLPANRLTPSGAPDTIVKGLPADRSHAPKSIALTRAGRLFVNIGAPTNSCQQRDRQVGAPGLDPCPQLANRAGIWVFAADRTGQTQADGQRYATGIRNAVALALQPGTGALFAMQHGRDQLHQSWPDYYDEEQGAEEPAEEFLHVDQGDDFGWPYCYYDWQQGEKLLAPEYGGNGHTVGRCASIERPVHAFPGHWAPDGLLFYTGDLFPPRYRGGAFIAFHGSWNRAPRPQAGYKVVFLPMQGDTATGDPAVFADGFAGGKMQPGSAAHRPTGLAQGPDGSLYITSDQSGRIWRVIYRRQ